MNNSLSALSQLNFSGSARLPLVRQTEAAECSLACLAMIAGYYGYRSDMTTLRRRFPISLKGVNLQTLLDMADTMKLASRPLKVDMEALDQIQLPAILHWDMNHFVVLKSVSRKGIIIHDPGRGEQVMDWNTVSKHYTGIAVEMQPAEGFQKADVRQKLKLSQLWSRLIGLKRAALQLLALSVILQLFVLISPFYVQLVIDQVLTKFDTDLLVVLAIGFGLFTLIYVAANALRGRLVLFIGGMMSYQMMINLFRHMIHLPQEFFDKRHIGDVDSRFASTEPIKRLLTEGLIAGLIDGSMALTTLVLMYIYSPMLATVTAMAFILNVVLRMALYRVFRRQNEDAILARAKEHTNFIETVRGIMSIKLFAGEGQRQQIWQNLLADVINAEVRFGKTKVNFELANKLLFGLENILVIYLAARMVLAGQFTIGMIFAFMAYKTLFTEKALALIEQLLEFRLIDLHLERISDIAMSDPEPDEDRLLTGDKLVGDIELRDVNFRYADSEPYVLKDLNLRIKPGESVAITGPSGCGKTTLVKIMLGLLRPQSGEVLVDGRPLHEFGLKNLREQVSAVMQEDRLFGGTLVDNIAFFDPHPNLEHVALCAEDAAILEEINSMPMGFETLVGDMGTTLSGGQKQRVMLARALYRKPRMLFLDEGTAHLDLETEREVNSAVANLGITRIIVAHRPDTVKSADRVLRFEGPELLEESNDGNHLTGQKDSLSVA